MPSKISQKDHALLLNELSQLLLRIGHNSARELHLADRNLREIGLSRPPINLLHKISLLQQIQKGELDHLSMKEVAKREGLSLKTVYRLFNSYYKKETDLIEEYQELTNRHQKFATKKAKTENYAS